jgi:CRISPR-associated protein Cmr4
MAQKLAFLHALSSLHAGTGQGIGEIDQPIARERATNLPFVPGSSIKGCLRDKMRGHPHENAIFGPPAGENASDYAGAFRASDARLLLLPVRSLGATFVWATSPYVLRRFQRDARMAGEKPPSAIPSVGDCEARVSSDDCIIALGDCRRLVLEDLDFAAQTAGAEEWCEWIASRLYPADDAPWRDEMKKRFAIIDDKSFDYFSEYAMEMTAHIRMDATTGTVVDGALWYQEALPAETVLYLLLQADKAHDQSGLTGDRILAEFERRHDVQFGGKAGTGLGIAQLTPVGGGRQ